MKTNLWLAGALIALLGVTWLLTEKRIFDKQPLAEVQIREAAVSAKHISLPAAQLTQDQEGAWRTADDSVVRAEYLQELSKTLSQVKIVKSFSMKNLAPGTNDFFQYSSRVVLDQVEMIIGDVSPTGEGFYFSVKGQDEVYLADLRDMSSMAVSDQENLLQREKFQRMIDLINMPADRWRDKRLVAQARFGAFRTWRSGELAIDIPKIKDRPWAEAILSALQAGIASLEIQGSILNEKPAKLAKINPWSFEVEDGTQLVWEFYQHPSLELIYVWIPRLGKAYPLNQVSSDFLRDFVPKLIARPFPLIIHPAPLESADLIEGDSKWTIELGQEDVPAGIDPERAELLLDLFAKKQTFDHLTLLARSDCNKLAGAARFKVHFKTGDSWSILPVKDGLVLLECEAGFALAWSIPLDSGYGFATLKKAK